MTLAFPFTLNPIPYTLPSELHDLGERDCVLVGAAAALAREHGEAGMVVAELQAGDQVASPDVLQCCGDLVHVLRDSGTETVAVLEVLQAQRCGDDRGELIAAVYRL